jgi:hypothetical protein
VREASQVVDLQCPWPRKLPLRSLNEPRCIKWCAECQFGCPGT